MKTGKGKGAVKKDTKEALKPVDDRKVGKRKAVSKADQSSKRKARNQKMVKKDPNKPKRPPSAFFVFLEEFRKTFKKENPNVKAVSAVGKAGGEKWKSLSKSEKAPYEARAAKKKAEYEKLINAYNKKQFFYLVTNRKTQLTRNLRSQNLTFMMMMKRRKMRRRRRKMRKRKKMMTE